MKKVIKRDGRVVGFNPDKIADAIKGSVEELNFNLEKDKLNTIVEKVVLYANPEGKGNIKVEKIQDLVVKVLKEENLKKIADAYAEYRKERTKVREIKSDLMVAIQQIGVQTDRDNGATSCC